MKRDLDEMRRTFISEFLCEYKKRPNVLYVHTPFCKSRCSYCIYDSTDNFSTHEFDYFYDTELNKQIELYKDIFENVVFDQVYFGGGTPTICSADKLSKVFSSIPNFANIKNKCIESTPVTLTDDHVQLFKENNFSFLSIGIQSLDGMICKKHNRPHLSRNEFELLSEKLRESGVYFNYDLICYMDRGDVRDILQFRDDLNRVINVGKPHGITIHQLNQSYYSIEKTKLLIKTIRDALIKNTNYSCVNSLLNDDDALNDTLYSAEYKLEKDKIGYSHYMWNKYASMPIEGYNVLSIGFYKGHKTISSVDKTYFCESLKILCSVNYDHFIFETYKQIRNHLNMPLY